MKQFARSSALVAVTSKYLTVATIATMFLLRTEAANAQAADIVFLGEHIITVDSTYADTKAVAVKGEKISYVGSLDGAHSLIGAQTRVVSLGENALVPGFIDSHGHIAATARFIDYANLSAPPVGDTRNIEELISNLQLHLESKALSEVGWLIGYGYDNSLLSDRRHPSRADLDRVSATIPIFVAHVSGHLGVLNSPALQALGINSATPDPAGGVIRRDSQGKPTGVLEESAVANVFRNNLLGSDPPAVLERKIRDAIGYYASYGITTVQDGGATSADIKVFREAAEREAFAVDIAAYQYLGPGNIDAIREFDYQQTYGESGYRVAGIKFGVDGSPQGRTAWMRTPYTQGPKGAAKDYVAYPTVDPSAFKRGVRAVLARNIPLHVHANGDAAIELMLDGVAEAVSELDVDDHRSVIVHAQLMGEDQVVCARAVGALPSFFAAHTFFWGDWHVESFGEERGENISPTGWAKAKGLPFTLHNDSPVVPPDMMRLLWAATNRVTRSGRVIGPAHRLGVTQALYALTMAGAYQMFEEDRKGSITPGKQADLVILDRDPRDVPVAKLADVAIIETFARGESVFRMSGGQRPRRE